MKYILIFLISISLFVSCATPRPWNKQEKTAAYFFILAHSANAFTTSQLDDNGNYEKYNFILDKHPSDTEVGIYFSITGGLALALSHFYPKLRKPLLYGYGFLNTCLVIHDYNLNK